MNFIWSHLVVSIRILQEKLEDCNCTLLFPMIKLDIHNFKQSHLLLWWDMHKEFFKTFRKTCFDIYFFKQSGLTFVRQKRLHQSSRIILIRKADVFLYLLRYVPQRYIQWLYKAPLCITLRMLRYNIFKKKNSDHKKLKKTP